MERGRCPRADLQTAPGQLRASASQHYRDWGARCSLDWDRSRAGNTRTNCVRCCPPEGGSLQIGAQPRPRKHGLKLGLREESSLRSEPRWNADRCAHPAGCAAVPAARQVGLASVGVPLPFSYCSWLGEAGVADSEKQAPPLLFLRATLLRTSNVALITELGRASAPRERGRSSFPVFRGMKENVHAQTQPAFPNPA